MKRHFTLLLSLFAILSAQAQITITASDITAIGITAVQTVDTLPDASITEGGAGLQSWDYTALKDQEESDFTFLMPDETPFFSEFPNANLAAKSDSLGYIYFTFNDQAFKIIGTRAHFEIDSATSFDVSVRINPGQSLLRFPATFGNSYEETTLQTIAIEGALIGFPFDSVRLETTTKRNVSIDAYGDLTTPVGNYEVIRSSEMNLAWDSTYILFAGVWQLVDGSAEPDTSYNYNFWTNTNDLGFPVVQVEYEPEFDAYSVTWLKSIVTADNEALQGPAVELFPNPASEFLNLRFEEAQSGTAEVFDMNGKLVASQKLDSSEAQIRVSGLAAGTHLLVLKDQKGKMLTFRLFQKS
jgi:hypothetical protein